jgi:hypothetical protein
MTQSETKLVVMIIALVGAIVYTTIIRVDRENDLKYKYQKTIDSLKHTSKCYCTKLQFCDTLTDKEIDLAFKKSRGRIL